MKYLIRKIYFILIILLSFFISSTSFSKTEINKYSQDKTSNYLSGIVSIDQNYTKKAFDYLSKVKSLKNSHHNYNIKFLHTLVLLEKFDEAFKSSPSITVTLLPTVAKDCGFFPGEITIIGIFSAKTLLEIKENIIINTIVFRFVRIGTFYS